VLDATQTGYGPGYRIYRGADGEWLALVIPDAAAWSKLAAVAPIPSTYVPLRGGGSDDALAREAEGALDVAFSTASAAEWVDRLRGLGLLAELVATPDRDGFRRAILDDPVNRRLGRVASYETADWGHFEQIGPLLRCGPDAAAGPELVLPRVGEHSLLVLDELAVPQEDIDGLVKAKVVRQL